MEGKSINQGEGERATDQDGVGVGRSYECAFCKRGFTNAQALGGHMNIHRKDKAKAKQKNHGQASIQVAKPSENYANSRYLARISSSVERRRMSYQVYLPAANPSIQSQCYERNVSVWVPEEHLMDYYPDVNLRMRTGMPQRLMEEEEGVYMEGISKDNEIDLELRLGYDHP